MYYAINDAAYWYEIDGNSANPPVVMLHGFTGSTSTWSDFVSNWKSELRIITIDLPGHGQTQTPTPRTVEACCEELKGLFQFLQLEEIVLHGYSMGGRVALSFAMLYPAFIQSLILESASPGLAYKEDRNQRIKKDEILARKLETEGVQKFIHFWESIPMFQSQRKLPISIQEKVRKERLAQSADGLAQSLRYMGTGFQPSWWEQLKHFTKPSLLLTGEYDEKFISINKGMNDRMYASDLKVIEQAGHAIHVEQPEIFGKLVIEFIKQR